VRLVDRELARSERRAIHARERDHVAGAIAHGHRRRDSLARGGRTHRGEDRQREIESDLASRDEAIVIHSSSPQRRCAPASSES
jgi:hypothetical protein